MDVGIVGKLKSVGLIGDIPKSIPIFVSGVMVAKGWDNFDQFHVFFMGKICGLFPTDKYFFCITRAPDELCQFP